MCVDIWYGKNVFDYFQATYRKNIKFLKEGKVIYKSMKGGSI